jgi:hypothetical protein
VKLRANGKCEFCGEPGFISTKGTPYLECHHIIALANDGADRMTNVIALCPKDHREAHFGERGGRTRSTDDSQGGDHRRTAMNLRAGGPLGLGAGLRGRGGVGGVKRPRYDASRLATGTL